MPGYINSNGKYIRGRDKNLSSDVSDQFKSWNHDNQRKRFSGDIVQPYTLDGKPNPEFIRIHRGEVADKYFNREQQDQADRNLGGLGT